MYSLRKSGTGLPHLLGADALHTETKSKWTMNDANDGCFAKDQLVEGVEGIPRGHCEMYLSEFDFQELFKMDKTAFEKLPAWKKTQQKKAIGLF